MIASKAEKTGINYNLYRNKINGIIVEYIFFYTRRVNDLEHTERHFKFLPHVFNVCTTSHKATVQAALEILPIVPQLGCINSNSHI